MAWSGFLLAYLLGGLTFLPLVVAVVFAHAYISLPRRPDAAVEPVKKRRASSGDRPDAAAAAAAATAAAATAVSDDLPPKTDGAADSSSSSSSSASSDKDHQPKPWAHDGDVASGYFAVCREYTPMGINAKPIERSTPVGSTTVASPSQSVYQTMYRSIFERKQAPGPLDDKNNVSQRPKKGGNVFYVVLRHGHLMLFDDEEQLEVRHVISLAHHDVSIYSGGDVTPEGELWIKRSALCLSRKKDAVDKVADAQTSKPFYLFSENCSAKEDFYFALLRNQALSFGADAKSPAPLGFNVNDMLSLVQRLHSTEEHMHTRWLNAFLGRIFLSIKDTADFEHFIREKLTTKISRVNRPTFLSDISIRAIDPGDSAPWVMNPRLRDFNVEGECIVEADVRYTGNFRIEVATKVRIDLGARFKVREVDVVLAVVLRKIEGRMMFKLKPPPSNRIWQTFQTMPKIELTIEPIVSSRQITYTLILRQIENRIKEVVAETMVLPSWDDTPFFRTEHKRWRGGIFQGDDAVMDEESPSSSLMAIAMERLQRDKLAKEKGSEKAHESDAEQHPAEKEHHHDEGADRDEGDGPGSGDLRNVEKSHSLPNLEASQLGGLFSRKVSRGGGQNPANGSSASLDTSTPDIHVPPAPQSPRPAHTAEPAKPVVVMTNAQDIDPDQFPDVKSYEGPRSRASFSSATSNSGQNTLSAPSRPAPVAHSPSHSSASSQNEDGPPDDDQSLTPSMRRRNTASSSESLHDRPRPPPTPSPSGGSAAPSVRSQTGSTGSGSNSFVRRESLGGVGGGDGPGLGIAKRTTLAAVTNAAAQATAQARQWGWNALQRRKDQQTAKKTGGHTRGSSVDLSQPMGGGRPFPPPGTPLPGPETPPTKIAPSRSSSNLHSTYNSNQRPSLPPRPGGADEHDARRDQEPSLPRKRIASLAHERDQSAESLMVVAAPEESEPTTPVSESILESEEDGSVPDTPQTTQGMSQNKDAAMGHEERDRPKVSSQKSGIEGRREDGPIHNEQKEDGDSGSESSHDSAPHVPSPPVLIMDEHGVQEVGGPGYPNWVEEN